MTTYEELINSIVKGEQENFTKIIDQLLKDGYRPADIIDQGLIKGMSSVGEKWKAGELFIPEVIMSADIVNEGMKKLKPLMAGDEQKDFYIGKVVLGTVEGDVHSIGKDLVAIVLQSGGFEVINLGVDVPTTKFVEAVKQEKPDILGLSSLLTSTMPRMKDIIGSLKQNGLRDQVQIMVGGAPIDQAYANTIGADGYASDALSAVDKAKKLLTKN